MKHWGLPFYFLLCGTVVILGTKLCCAQSTATASRSVDPSAFVGLSGAYTGLEGSRNVSLTVGLDLGFHPFRGFLPAFEVRGTYPFANGTVVGEESVEGGLRVSKRYTRVRPYADILFGRGQLNYQNGGFIVPAQNFRYIQSSTNVFSPGVGVEIDATEHLAVLLDGQLQHWNLPFNTGANPANSGGIYSKIGTIGVVYRFNWLEHGHAAP